MPVNLFNDETQKWEPVAVADAVSFLRSGKYRPAAEDIPKLNLKTKYGDGTASNEQEFYDILRNGGRLETEVEAESRRLKEFEGPLDKAAAAAVGFVGGATMGLSSVASIALPEGAQNYISDVVEANPITSSVFEAAGVGASVIASGGTGALAQIAARTPAAMAIKAAAKGGAAVAKTLTKTHKAMGHKGVESVIKTAATMSLDAGFMGAGSELSEVVLDDTLENGEFLAATARIVTAGFTSAATGAVLGGVGGTLVSAARKMTASTKNLLENHYKHSISDEAADLTNKMAKGAPVKPQEAVVAEVNLALKDALAAEKAFAPKARINLEVLDDLPATKYVQQVEDFKSTAESLNIEKWAARSDMGNQVKDSLQKFQLRQWKALNEYGEGTLVGGLKGSINTQRVLPYQSYQSMYNELGEHAGRLSKSGHAEDAMDLEDMQEILRQSLVAKPDVWGKVGQRFDDAARNFKTDDTVFLSKYGKGQKLDNLYESLKNSPDDELAVWDNFIAGKRAKLEEMLNHEKDPKIRQGIKTALDSFHELRARVKHGVDHAVASKIAPHIPKSDKTPSQNDRDSYDILKKVADINGVGAAALNLATGGGFSAGQMLLRGLSKIASNTESNKKVIDFAVDGLAKVGRATRTPGRVIATGVAVGAGRQAAAKEQRLDSYKRAAKIQKQLRSYTGIIHDPINYMEQLQAQIPELAQMAPRVTQALIDTKMRSGAFLLMKAQELGISDDPRNVSVRQNSHKILRMERYMDAVENPMKHIRKLERGVMSREAIEVVKQVYPKIYSTLVSSTSQRISEMKGAYPSYVIRQMSVLLDYPFDPLYTPEMVNTFQAAHAVAGGQPNDVAGKQSGRPRGITNVKHQTQMRENLTPSQQQEAR